VRTESSSEAGGASCRDIAPDFRVCGCISGSVFSNGLDEFKTLESHSANASSLVEDDDELVFGSEGSLVLAVRACAGFVVSGTAEAPTHSNFFNVEDSDMLFTS